MIPEPTDPRDRLRLEGDRVVRRLAALGPRRIPDEPVRATVGTLARLAWRAEGRPGDPPVIDLAPHGWADAIRVLIGDLLDAGGGGPHGGVDRAADELSALRGRLP